MTITLPTIIETALNNEAAKFEQSGPEFLKSVLFTALHSKDGFTLKLHRPTLEPDPAQLSLPLGGGTKASELS